MKLKPFLILLSTALVASCGGSTSIQQNEITINKYEPTYPSRYEEKIKEYLKYSLKDFDTMKGFQITSTPKIGVLNYGAFRKGPEGKIFGNKQYFACASFNAKNSYGGYVGYKNNAFFFDNGEITQMINARYNGGDLDDWEC